MNNMEQKEIIIPQSYTDCKNIESPIVKIAFEQGAKWADENPIENTNKRRRRTCRNGIIKTDCKP